MWQRLLFNALTKARRCNQLNGYWIYATRLDLLVCTSSYADVCSNTLSQTAGYRLLVAEHVSRNIWKKVCEYLVEIRWNRDLDIIFKEEWMEHLVKYVWWEIVMLINRRYYSEGVVRKLLWSKNWNNIAGMVSKQYKDWKSYWWFPIEIQ